LAYSPSMKILSPGWRRGLSVAANCWSRGWDRTRPARRGALDEDNHHGGEGPVRGVNFAAAAEIPVEQSADQKGQRSADERPAKEAHGVAGEIEHVAEGESVEIGIFVEQVEEFQAGSRGVRGQGSVPVIAAMSSPKTRRTVAERRPARAMEEPMGASASWAIQWPRSKARPGRPGAR